VQVEIVHRREQELLKFKKDAELAITTAESNEATLKKRFQEQLNEVNEQLERANKAKTKYVSASSSSFDDLTITVCPVFTKHWVIWKGCFVPVLFRTVASQ